VPAGEAEDEPQPDKLTAAHPAINNAKSLAVKFRLNTGSRSPIDNGKAMNRAFPVLL